MPIPTKRLRDLIDFGPHSFPLRHTPELEAFAGPLGGAVVFCYRVSSGSRLVGASLVQEAFWCGPPP
jgi:hypothetical protein